MEHVETEGARYLAVSGTLDASGETLFLDMLCDVSPLFAARDAQLRAYSRVFLLLLVLCALLTYALSGALTRPLTKLSEASLKLTTRRASR